MGQRGQPPILGAIFAVLAAALGGCAPKPPALAPPPPEVRDAGLPAYNLKNTAGHIADSLLADPKINANRKSWTLAVDRMEDNTTNSAFSHDYNELLDRLRTALFQQSNGRVQLIEKRAAPHDLSTPASPNSPPGLIAPAHNMRPDYLLSGIADALPDRGSGYFQLEFSIANAPGRPPIWNETFDVHAER